MPKETSIDICRKSIGDFLKYYTIIYSYIFIDLD